MKKIYDITPEKLNKVLSLRGGKFIRLGSDCSSLHCCVMEARSLALGKGFNSNPDRSPRDAWARTINDLRWSSNDVRTECLREVALRREPTEGWPERLAILTVNRLLPKLIEGFVEDDIVASCRRAFHIGEAVAASAVAFYELRNDVTFLSQAPSNLKAAADGVRRVMSQPSLAVCDLAVASAGLTPTDDSLRFAVHLGLDCWFND